MGSSECSILKPASFLFLGYMPPSYGYFVTSESAITLDITKAIPLTFTLPALTTSSTQLVAACAKYHPSVSFSHTEQRAALGITDHIFRIHQEENISCPAKIASYPSQTVMEVLLRPGSPPVRTPYSGYAPAPYGELAVWSLDLLTSTLKVPLWVNPDKTTNPVTLIYYTDTNSKAFLYGVGNLDAFKASTKFTGISRLVSLQFVVQLIS
ncbi:hypothetical protein DL96DRAFT_1781898 [Flagelloscypha sp. PMI_526]|nr:hypothetical protein DL96DRAFT_1781898 [Flagelloscypha sp. PMI_526]